MTFPYLEYKMLIQVGNAGSVELLDTFGDDLTVVNAARVSFNKESTEFTQKDAGLVKYLATHEHTSPFFHPQLRFRLKMPIFIAREWFRHTVGFARNEVSRRYVDDKPELWFPNTFRERDQNLKQGSKTTEIENADAVRGLYKATSDATLKAYEAMLDSGVAPEIARTILPQGMYTEFIETGSLAAYARLCRLRMDPHAQLEIREFAGAIADFIVTKFPVSWAALLADAK
jgi:thymidylate synthase (FAD)